MKIGFIGAGNMAKAMMGGIIKQGLATPDEITASDVSEAQRNVAKDTLGVNVTENNNDVLKDAEVVIMAVKPKFYEAVISGIRETAKSNKTNQIFISIAPGITLDWLDEHFGEEGFKIVRTMPNTPALVGEGITGVAPGPNITDEDLTKVKTVLSSFSKVEIIDENLMDVVTSVSGSSPAYVFMFIEAMADAAVADGMPRAQAYTFAAQAVLGSAKMVLETGKHPGELKDMVCSPGGTTIEAVRVLEAHGFRSGVIEAMKACTKKSKGE